MKQRKKKCKALVALVLGIAMICSVIGSAGLTALADSSELTRYKSEFNSVQEVLDASEKLNAQIGDEGFVLLKNEKANLPFGLSVKKISLFGKNSVNPVYSGTGSSGGTSGSTIGIVESLQNAGFEVNPTLLNFYKDNNASGPVRGSMGFASYNYHSYFSTAETPQSKYTSDVKDSYAQYGDAAVVVLSRTGGEGTDLPRTSYVKEADEGKVPNASDARAFPTFAEKDDPDYKYYGGEGRTSDPHQHYLELDDNEKALLNEVTGRFSKVVVILNTANVMELDRELLVNNEKVQSIIWAPGGGQNAFGAIGRILNGSVNPSGRTTDTFAADFTKDPTWYNFGNNNIGFYLEGTAGNQYMTEDGTPYDFSKSGIKDAYKGIEGVDYEEGIYVGYKYWETRGFTDGDEWYNASVNYPFGYGLSYTNFTWKVSDVKLSTETLTPTTKISVDVKVTNIGSYAGKDVVQLYYSAPYTAGKTEKSHVVLGAFEKTGIIKPGKSETVTLELTGFDMASFDAYDKDGDGHKGYELDKGNYDFYVGKNAHDSWKNGVKRTVNLASEINIDKDLSTGADIKPIFDTSTEYMKDKTLSRNDWDGTFPKAPTEEELMKDADWLKNFEMPIKEGANKGTQEVPNPWGGGTQTVTIIQAIVDTWYDEANPDYPNADGTPGRAPWYAETAPSFRAEADAYTAENKAPIQLADMVGVAYDDAKWDEFLSQLTVNQAYELMKATQFEFKANEGLGIPSAGHSDGPLGLTGAWVGGGQSLLSPRGGLSKFGFATETLIGCTWNKDIARRQGELVGDFGLWAHVVGWYAPGANIHRSPFSGRNFEYYSEDATLSGYMLTEVVAGARSKGMVTFMKHYALNDSETNRDTNSIATWADEQTMRECYFKPFEWAIKRADSNGAMSAFNRIGFDWTGASYEFLTELTRNEWGFKGVVITDAHGSGCGSMFAGQMIRCGNDMSLDSSDNSIARIVNNEEANTPTQLTALKNSIKHILYAQVNSAAMYNGVAFGKSITYTTPATTSVQVKPGENVALSVSDGTENSRYAVITGKLPNGVTINANGMIEGIVANDVKAGDYSVVVAKVAENAQEGEYYLNSKIKSRGSSPDGSVTYTITVTEDGALANAVTPVSVVGFEKIGTVDNVDYYAFIMSDGTEYYYTVTNGSDGQVGENGQKGEVGAPGQNGPQGPQGEPGKDASSTLGGVGIALGIVGLLAGVAALAMVLLKKKNG